jgi:predicted nucleic acid-binding protein
MAEMREGFWYRAGRLRADVLANRRKARLGDALIAQFCADHNLPLITRDRDFCPFVETANLNVLFGPAKA